MRLYTYAGSANCYKIALALAQLERRYEAREVEIFDAKPADFLAHAPAGRVPALERDDGSWVVESNAILWDVAQGTPLLPGAPRDVTEVVSWLCFEQNSIEPVIGSARYWRLTGRERGREDETRRRIESGAWALGVLDAALATRRWLAGDRYSIADIAVYAYGHLAPDVGIELAGFPHVLAWCRRVEAEPRFFAGPGPYSTAAMRA
jgi:glutathione S-transferase